MTKEERVLRVYEVFLQRLKTNDTLLHILDASVPANYQLAYVAPYIQAEPSELGLVIIFHNNDGTQSSRKTIPLFSVRHKKGEYKDRLDRILGKNTLELPDGMRLCATEYLRRVATVSSQEIAALVFWKAFIWFGTTMQSLGQRFDPVTGTVVHQ